MGELEGFPSHVGIFRAPASGFSCVPLAPFSASSCGCPSGGGCGEEALARSGARLGRASSQPQVSVPGALAICFSGENVERIKEPIQYLEKISVNLNKNPLDAFFGLEL